MPLQNRKNLQTSWVMLGCAWLMGFSMFTPMLCIPPMAHIIREELALSNAQVSLLFSTPFITLALLAITGGILADRIGVRKAAGIAAIVMMIGSLLRGTSTSFETLISFTCLYGVGFGLVFPNLPKLVGAWFPPQKAGLATGIYTTGIMTGSALSLAITLPLVFPITNTFQGTIYIWTIPAIVATILWWAIVKEPSPSVQSQEVVEKVQPSYVVWRSKDLWLVTFILFIVNFYFVTWGGWTPTLLMMKGAQPNLAALITSTINWVSIPAAFIIPWASYKLGLRKPFLWGSAIALAFVSWGAIYLSVPYFWLLVVIDGICAGGALAILFGLPAEMVPKDSVGTASGMVISIGHIGAFIGPWLAGYILDATGSLDLDLIVLIGAAIVCACLAFIVAETGTKARLKK